MAEWQTRMVQVHVGATNLSPRPLLIFADGVLRPLVDVTPSQYLQIHGLRWVPQKYTDRIPPPVCVPMVTPVRVCRIPDTPHLSMSNL